MSEPFIVSSNYFPPEKILVCWCQQVFWMILFFNLPWFLNSAKVLKWSPTNSKTTTPPFSMKQTYNKKSLLQCLYYLWVAAFSPYCQPSDLSPTIVIMSPSVNDNWLSTSAVNEYKAWTCIGGLGAADLGGKVLAVNNQLNNIKYNSPNGALNIVGKACTPIKIVLNYFLWLCLK